MCISNTLSTMSVFNSVAIVFTLLLNVIQALSRDYHHDRLSGFEHRDGYRFEHTARTTSQHDIRHHKQKHRRDLTHMTRLVNIDLSVCKCGEEWYERRDIGGILEWNGGRWNGVWWCRWRRTKIMWMSGELWNKGLIILKRDNSIGSVFFLNDERATKVACESPNATCLASTMDALYIYIDHFDSSSEN